MINKRLYATTFALLLTLALSSCGGSDNRSNDVDSPEVSAGAAGSFFTAVRALISTSPENTEPVAIDSPVATSPENIEPAQL